MLELKILCSLNDSGSKAWLGGTMKILYRRILHQEACFAIRFGDVEFQCDPKGRPYFAWFGPPNTLKESGPGVRVVDTEEDTLTVNLRKSY